MKVLRLAEDSILRILQYMKRELEICHRLIQLDRKVEGREGRQLSDQQELGVSTNAQGKVFCFYHDAGGAAVFA